jgi:hypothetical protein
MPASSHPGIPAYDLLVSKSYEALVVLDWPIDFITVK